MSNGTERATGCLKCGRGSSVSRKRRGLCNSCYKKDLAEAKAAGTYKAPIRDVGARILAGVEINSSGCWIWTGAVIPTNGYGQISVQGRRRFVHRLAYETFVGAIPEGLEIDHRCHSQNLSCEGNVNCPHRLCCNPDHLEPVTTAENCRRSNSPMGKNARKTHCSRGHEFNAENTIVAWRNTPAGMRKSRKCRKCERIWKQKASR